MASPGITHAEWLNENSLRSYPFAENCARRPDDGNGGFLSLAYAIPNYAFVDFVVTVPEALMGRMYLSSMTLAGGVLTGVVSRADTQDPAGSFAVRLSAGMDDNLWVPFSGSGGYADMRGAVVVGDGSRLLSDVPDGSYMFQPSETLFEARCVRPSLAGVSALRVGDAGGNAMSRRIQGDVSLIAGENIHLRFDPGRNAIWIDADPNYGYKEECECDLPVKRISYINGISADEVTIEGGQCVKVTVKNGSIVIEDTCSKPCCGCEELTWLNQKASEIGTSTSKLLAYAEYLNDKIADLEVARVANSTAARR